MSGFVYLQDIPPKARALLHERFDEEDVQEWWNQWNRDPRLLGRPRDIWRVPGGSSRVRAVLTRVERTRPGLRLRVRRG